MSRGVLAALVALAAASAASACGDARALPPLGQILLYVDTDAPLPAPQGVTLGASEPAPLFDRLRIEIFRPGEDESCAECTNEFDVDREQVRAGRASVGIRPPPHASGYVARVRLFRGAFVELGQPRPDATIDVVAALPPVGDEGVVPVTVFLPTDSVGRPIGARAAPSAPEAGAPRGRVGTWPGARRVGCADAPSDDEVCVPGGAYWMGNPLHTSFHIANDAPVLRLVVLSPFYLQKREVQVPAFRASGLASADDPLPSDSPRMADQPVGVACTYTPVPGNFDRFPVNCVTQRKARDFCALRGGDLPTEAQFQYVAGGLEGRLYPWGTDAPACTDAVFARVRAVTGPFGCAGGGLAPSGSGERDRATYEGGEVVDLAGNLAEHVVDRWNNQGEACWRAGVLYDPVCDQPSAVAQLAAKTVVAAGNFASPGGFLAASFRNPSAPFPPKTGTIEGLFAASTGFRCARPATPAP